MTVMRRVLLASLFAATSISLGFVGTAGAAINPVVSLNPVLSGVPVYSNVILAFDYSDNSAPPTVSSGTPAAGSDSSLAPDGSFNIITDLFPENTGGFIRMVAVAPAGSGASNLVCPFQPVQQAQAECWFNFMTPGVWNIHAQYASDLKSSVSAESITNLRVGN
jgi:hypothetical protein